MLLKIHKNDDFEKEISASIKQNEILDKVY